MRDAAAASVAGRPAVSAATRSPASGASTSGQHRRPQRLRAAGRRAYLGAGARLARDGFGGPLYVMKSNGGAATFGRRGRARSHGRVGAGRRRDRRRGRDRRADRRAEPDHPRHRRHDGEVLADRGRRGQDHRPTTGSKRRRASAGYPIKVPVVDIVEIGAGGGSDRLDRRRRRAQRRAELGRRGARSGLLRPGRHGADRHRRQPDRRPDQPATTSSAARSRSTSSWRGERSSRSPTRSACRSRTRRSA